jgi:hypothetical protein
MGAVMGRADRIEVLDAEGKVILRVRLAEEAP